MATVARGSARTRAADLQARLADAIVNGVYLPGAKLDEQELADAFGVSRTPVREGLKHLAVTGLVALRPHRGAIVATITPANLGHLFETMAELEALCAGFAAARMRTAARRELRVMHKGAAGLVAAGDPVAYSQYNLVFHSAIYQGSANPYLAEATLAIRTRLAPFRGAQFRIPERLSRSQAEHQAVLDAILVEDRQAAAGAMLRHLLTVRDAAMRYAGASVNGGSSQLPSDRATAAPASRKAPVILYAILYAICRALWQLRPEAEPTSLKFRHKSGWPGFC